MANLDKYISTLLFEYDCVIVPQLGGFVTNYKPAEINESKGVISPPQKALGFNRNLTKSDGLLEQEFAQANGIAIKEASVAIKAEVESYWKDLNSGKKITFNKIGILYFDEDLKLNFEPSRETNYLKSSFGLGTLVLPKEIIHEEPVPTEQAKVIPIRNTQPNEETIDTPGRSRSIYWVAAAAMLPLVTMSLYFGIKTNFKSPTETSFADLVPGVNWKSDKGEYTERQKTFATNSTLLEEPFPEKKLFQYSFLESKIDSTGVWVNLEKKNTHVKPTGPYHIIAGCFEEKSNADKHVINLQKRGYDASILDIHKGLYRVKSSSYIDKSSALKGLKETRAKKGQAGYWLLKKRMNG